MKEAKKVQAAALLRVETVFRDAATAAGRTAATSFIDVSCAELVTRKSNQRYIQATMGSKPAFFQCTVRLIKDQLLAALMWGNFIDMELVALFQWLVFAQCTGLRTAVPFDSVDQLRQEVATVLPRQSDQTAEEWARICMSAAPAIPFPRVPANVPVAVYVNAHFAVLVQDGNYDAHLLDTRVDLWEVDYRNETWKPRVFEQARAVAEVKETVYDAPLMRTWLVNTLLDVCTDPGKPMEPCPRRVM